MTEWNDDNAAILRAAEAIAEADGHMTEGEALSCARAALRAAGTLLPFEPPGLRDLIDAWQYKPGWTLSLGLFSEDGDARCWALYVVSDTENSLDPEKRIRVRHEFLVPPASYKRDVWAVWINNRLGDVEMHERNEFSRINGVREFAPHHGNGEDPYITWHVSDYATAAKRAGDE